MEPTFFLPAGGVGLHVEISPPSDRIRIGTRASNDFTIECEFVGVAMTAMRASNYQHEWLVPDPLTLPPPKRATAIT
jgi:hypothetical protein